MNGHDESFEQNPFGPPSDSPPGPEERMQIMQRLAQGMEYLFPTLGFTLFVYDFGDNGRLDYVSNGRREDMIVACREFIARMEGSYIETPSSLQ